MPFETDADRLSMLQAAGEQLMIGGALTWTLWSNVSVESLGAMSTQPAALVRAIDATAVTTSTIVVRLGVNYRVAQIDPDGTGYVLLQLQRSA